MLRHQINGNHNPLHVIGQRSRINKSIAIHDGVPIVRASVLASPTSYINDHTCQVSVKV